MEARHHIDLCVGGRLWAALSGVAQGPPLADDEKQTMNWQVPRIDQGGAYGDPFAMPHPGGQGHLGQIMAPALSAEEQHFLSSCTTREYEEMARRKAEHMESAEHIAPQHNYPLPTKTSRYFYTIF